MSDLQIKRIETAIGESKTLEARLDSMGEKIELLLNDILEHQRTLHAVRFAMLREAPDDLTPEQQAKALAYCLANPLPPQGALATTPETVALARDGIICAQCYDYLDDETRPAAGPWEPYSDALYDEIQDADGSVWAAWRFDSTAKRKWGYAYTRRSGPPMDNETTVWETSSGRNLYPRLSPWMRRNPDYIARIIPPMEAEQ